MAVKPVPSVKTAALKKKVKSGTASGGSVKNNPNDLLKEKGGLTPQGTYIDPKRDPLTSSFGGVNGLSREQVNFLGKGADSTYSDYVSQNDDALAKRAADNALLKSRYKTDQDLAFKNMGYDPTRKAWNQNDVTTSYGNDINNQNYDFGARGATHSTEFINARQNLQNGYQRQADAADLAGQRYLADLGQDDTNALNTHDLGNTGAIKDALARYAASKQKVV